MAKLAVEQTLRKAKLHARQGQIEQARKLYQDVLHTFPNNSRARQGLAQLGAGMRPQPGSPRQQAENELVDLYHRGQLKAAADRLPAVLQQYPTSVVLWNIAGAISIAARNWVGAQSAFQEVVKLDPDYPYGHNNLGMALKEEGDLETATECFTAAIKLKPDYAEAHNNLGIVLQDSGRLEEAARSFAKAIRIKPDYSEAHNNMGMVQQLQGDLDMAGKWFAEAIRLRPDFADAYNNLGIVFQKKGQYDQALDCYSKALELKPGFAEACNNMGNAFREKNMTDAAIEAYRHAVKFNAKYAEACFNLATAYQEASQPLEAIEWHQKALAIAPHYKEAKAQLLHQKLHVCDWSVFDGLEDVCAGLGIIGAAVSPFVALPLEDNPERQMLRSRKWAEEKHRPCNGTLPARPDRRPEKLRIGYFSADFQNHATLHLMSGLLREHDRERFEIHAYSYGRDADDAAREHVVRNVDVFTDIQGLPDKVVHDLAREHEIDIAIDLKGYTKGTRNQLFDLRLAPLQINYLGYPGTMAADFVDYIIADQTVIPADGRRFYTENVLYLPHSYQPNDNLRKIADTLTSRRELGLPEDGFVFCSFNQTYKISPDGFDIWMCLLDEVEGSVLWLLRSNRQAEENLRREATNRGMDPNRLVFAPGMEHSAHLARLRHADLFLDTFNVNAHTTASDALWAGVPVITCEGEQFAARVASSLLKASDLEDLVVTTASDYEALALGIARDPERLAALKLRVAEAREQGALFDTKAYTRHFEAALDAAYGRYLAGRAPTDIHVASEL